MITTIVTLLLGLYLLVVSVLDGKRQFSEALKKITEAQSLKDRRKKIFSLAYLLSIPIVGLTLLVIGTLSAVSSSREVASLKPENQRIGSVQASGWMRVRGTNTSEVHETTKIGETRLWFGKLDDVNKSIWKIHLKCTDLEKAAGGNETFYQLKFDEPPFAQFYYDLNIYPSDLVGTFESWDVIALDAGFLYSPTEVVTGEIHVTLNSSVKRKLTIPPQTALSRIGFVEAIEGTSESNVPVQVWARFTTNDLPRLKGSPHSTRIDPGNAER